jgi:hypothetical protein
VNLPASVPALAAIPAKGLAWRGSSIEFRSRPSAVWAELWLQKNVASRKVALRILRTPRS